MSAAISTPEKKTCLQCGETGHITADCKLEDKDKETKVEHGIDELNDQTMINGEEWKTLKEYAMQDNYKQQLWWGTLSAEEELLLEDLRDAQQNQGDMGELGNPQSQKDDEPPSDSFENTDESITRPSTIEKQDSCQVQTTETTRVTKEFKVVKTYNQHMEQQTESAKKNRKCNNCEEYGHYEIECVNPTKPDEIDQIADEVDQAEKKLEVKDAKVNEEEYGFHAPESDGSETDFHEPKSDEDADMISNDDKEEEV